MKTRFLPLLALSVSLLSFIPAEAAWVIQSGKIKDASRVPTMSVEKHYEYALAAYERGKWDDACTHFGIISMNFPNAAMGPECSFFYGVCLFQLKEFEAANDALNTYLKASCQPKYFEEAMAYKYAIACEFCGGELRRPFGTKQLPKCLPAKSLSVLIFDEIIQAMPCHEFAAQSLWQKGRILWEDCAYQESVDAYQTLIRRFPKHELTPQCYVAINHVFLTESEWEFQNPDLLQLAEINLKKFKQEFPRDERVPEAESSLLDLKETYAAGLFKTARYYEGQGSNQAAMIYYINALKQFPETRIAEKCQQRLQCLKNGQR